jgi:hypothetical protein
MSKRTLLRQVAQKYRDEGFNVVLAPKRDDLPAFLHGQDVDLIARKDEEQVAVRVKRRDELYDIPAFAETVNAQPGWSFDLVVYPPDGDEFPRNGTAQAPEYTTSLIAEADRLMNQGTAKAALVIAWAAAEAAMREAARREGIELEKLTPRFVLKRLQTEGLVSGDEYKTATDYLELRNEVVHGFQPSELPPDATQFLLDLARRLQSGETVPRGF